MRSSLRLGLSALVLALAPVAAHAQAQFCPGNPPGTLEPVPGSPGNYMCVYPTSAAPEIGATSSVAGMAVLLGGAMMLRGRKRTVAAKLTA